LLLIFKIIFHNILKDIANRIDLRDYCIVSIDPPGCTDIDDALHCRLLENGNFEVKIKENFLCINYCFILVWCSYC